MKTAGKYLYIIPLAVFGLMHFANGDQLTGMMPDWMPMKIVLVYITGAALLAATASLILNKMAPLAMMLLGIMLLSFVFLIHVPSVMGGDQMAVGMILKDASLAGAAFYLSANLKEEE